MLYDPMIKGTGASSAARRRSGMSIYSADRKHDRDYGRFPAFTIS
jgi:hypothetical protein